ncbi:MAG: hypothetical protein ACI9TH_003766, partial [Kiritimatiellia bacterium]
MPLAHAVQYDDHGAMRKCVLFFSLFLALGTLHASELLITEFMARNDSTRMDKDGAFEDWIEIYNASSSPVNLGGWHLTDRTNVLTMWTFPAELLAPGEYLLVFASEKDLRIAGQELHTNFRLAGEGEALALVRSDLSICHAYLPAYPEQYDDIAYGLNLNGRVLVKDGSPVEIHVPGDGSLGTTWTQPGFNVDELTWQDGVSGVGFGLLVPGLSVRFVDGPSGISHIDNAEALIASPETWLSSAEEVAVFIDYHDTGGTGHYGNDRDFPSVPRGSDANTFAVDVTGFIFIPSAGDWTFVVNSDDGFRLRLDGLGASFTSEFPGPRGASDTLATWNIPQAGLYSVRLTFYENGGGAGLEFFAAPGAHAIWNAGSFDLVGDTTNGGLEVFTLPGGVDAPFQTDISTLMEGVNASVYLRFPFVLDDINEVDALSLDVAYNDGFVLYLNGTSVATRNAPGSLSWNSVATAERTDLVSLVSETINLTALVGSLNTGTNVLAFQGLNHTVADDSFLLRPVLSATGNSLREEAFLASPTPGGINSEPQFIDVVKDTKFNPDRGFFTNAFAVTISTATLGAEIRYTLDGSEPTASSGIVYTGPIPVDKTTTLRAAAFRLGFTPTDVDTHTYIFPAQVVLQPDLPAGWEAYTDWGGGISSDYGMDPDVVNDPLYANEIVDDLLSIPTMAVSMDRDDFIGPNGIYFNPNGAGLAWERAASMEMMYPDGREGFQINCAIRIHGGAGRNRDFFKHNFRFIFKAPYGPTKLQHDLFGGNATDAFDTLIIRAGFNNSWTRGSAGEERQAQLLRDEFIRRTQLALGRPSPHGSFVHLYIDGLYWGLYNLAERPSAPFCASYFGGPKDEWDALNSSEPVDGNKTAWTTAIGLANAGVTNAALFDAISQYVDVPNLIDYCLVNFYGGNGDWDDHNWYSGRRRLPGEGYKFFSWDGERTLEATTGSNRTGVNQDDKPSKIYAALRAYEPFNRTFGDRAHWALFNGGPLSPEACDARYRELAELIEGAIVCESARWGDTKRAIPYTRDAEWATERDRLYNDYFPRRSDVVKGFLRGANLYPGVDAPSFSKHGGVVASGQSLLIAANNSTIYYTLDGRDPMMPNGSVYANAAPFLSSGGQSNLLARGSTWRYLDDGSDQGSAWISTNFVDSAWASGPAPLGYGEPLGSVLQTEVGFGPSANPKYTTTYFRTTFVVDDLDTILSVTCNLQRDDGGVVYLNGVELDRSNMPGGTITYRTPSGGSTGNEADYYPTQIAVDNLVKGTNVVAVSIHQINSSSSDIRMDLEIIAQVDPGDGLALLQSRNVKARVFDGSEWSALNDATFVIDQAPALVLSEVMYHAAVPEGAELGAGLVASDFDFIELFNAGSVDMGLAGVALSGGIDFDFTGGGVAVLAPGEYVLVVSDLAAFQLRYSQHASLPIAGVYTGELNDGGERVRLGSALLGIQYNLDYNDARGWPLSTDGAGHSLVPKLLEPPFGSDPLDYGGHWRASTFRFGSPGLADPEPVQDLLINELAAHTDHPGPLESNDWIELYNGSTGIVNFTDWYLSDDTDDLRKWSRSVALAIGPGAWRAFDEVNDFHNPTNMGFGLSKDGEAVYLSYLPGDARDRVADAVAFKAQQNGLSWGRVPDGGPHWVTTQLTRGSSNLREPLDLLIAEVMFHPRATTAHPEDNTRDEYIALHNPNLSPVSLMNTDGVWRVAGEVEYYFPASTVIGAGETVLIIPFSPLVVTEANDFISVYGLAPGSVNLFGPYNGKLSNRGGRIALERPQDTLPGDPPAWEIVDEMIYFDRAPWSSSADASGLSLHRNDFSQTGNESTNWTAGLPSPANGTLIIPRPVLQLHPLGPTSRMIAWDAFPGLSYTV